MTQSHQIMGGCEICIQAGTYQESLNYWRKHILKYINNHKHPLTRISVEQLNAENIFSINSDVVLPDGESVHLRAKYAVFSSMCDFPGKRYQVAKVVMCVKLLQ